MNELYLYEYINTLERVLSTGYKYQYSNLALEKAISYSSFFQKLEKDNGAPMISEQAILKEIFPELDVDPNEVPTYNQCLWAAEAFLRIQKETGFTFECIFMYISITKMYEYFPIYHEMDFSKIIDVFKVEYASESILSKILKKKDLSLKELSTNLDVSYDTLFSLKQRRRDIKKMNVAFVSSLANRLNVRIETLTELIVASSNNTY